MKFPLYQDKWLNVHVGNESDYSRAFSECDEFGNCDDYFLMKGKYAWAQLDIPSRIWKGQKEIREIEVSADEFQNVYFGKIIFR